MDGAQLQGIGALWMDQVAEQVGEIPLVGNTQPVVDQFPFPLRGDRLAAELGNHRRAASSFVKPVPLPPAPPAAPTIVPSLVNTWRPRRAPDHRHLRGGGVIPTLAIITVPGRGPAGAFTLVLDIADNAQTNYKWPVNVIPAYDGQEQRIALAGAPQETYRFSSVLTDAQLAEIQSRLGHQGALGSVFLVGLGYESLQLAQTTSGPTVFVVDTSLSDWCYPGARVVLVRYVDDITATSVATLDAVVQSVGPTSVVLNVSVGAFGAAGNLIMPAVPCYLESEQQGGLHPVNAGRFELRARAILFGTNQTSDWSPVGPTIATYTDPESAVVYPVWDQLITVDDVANRALLLGNEVVDRGATITNVAKLNYAQTLRQLGMTVKSDTDRQWLKKFIGATWGRQRPFLLPTWKPDLRLKSQNVGLGTITVYGPPTLNSFDFVGQIWTGIARDTKHYRRVQLLIDDGHVEYQKVVDAVDNGDGSQTLLLDGSWTGTVTQVSFLELVRFESEDTPIEWVDCVGHVELEARVVQG